MAAVLLTAACRPEAVRDLRGNTGAGEFNYITWTESIDYTGFVVGYEVYRDGGSRGIQPTQATASSCMRWPRRSAACR